MEINVICDSNVQLADHERREVLVLFPRLIRQNRDNGRCRVLRVKSPASGIIKRGCVRSTESWLPGGDALGTYHSRYSFVQSSEEEEEKRDGRGSFYESLYVERI